MSTFPYVDISHKKIWRPLSTGRYVDPTVLLYLFISGPAPFLPGPTAALCANGAGPAGTPAGTWPGLGGLGQPGGCVRRSPPSPALPSSPLAW